MSELVFTKSDVWGSLIALDMDWNVLDGAGKPKPYTAEQQVQLLRLFLKHSMASQSYFHHRDYADIIKDQEGLEQKERAYSDILAQIRELIKQFDGEKPAPQKEGDSE